MANEFLNKPSSIKPAIVGTIADPDEYNANIAGQSKDSVVGIDEDGTYDDFDMGDETLAANGSLVSDLKYRDTAKVKTYNASGVLQQTISIDQASESESGPAEIATQGETDTGTDDTKMVTPLKLANFASLAGGNLVSVQTFTSSGTWNKPAGVNAVMVEVQAGGGGGSEGFGGNNAGSSGGSSSFGSHLSATGGAGGVTDTGGAGGIGSSGDVNIRGGAGGVGSGDNVNSSMSGNGGDGFFAGGGSGSGNSGAGSAGSNGGGGGGGFATTFGGTGGGAGGYSREFINSGLGSSETITIGAGGAGGTGGAGGDGGAGGGGLIIITEYT